MSDLTYWHDGDTTYDEQGHGTRLAGANTSEMKTGNGHFARDASTLATLSGYTPTGKVTEDKYGREVRQFADAQGNSLGQALVNTGLASPMSGDMANGVGRTNAAARELLGMPKTGIERDPGFQFLAEQARSERLAMIDRYIVGGGHRADLAQAALAQDPREQRGIVDRAWDRGVDNMQGTFYGFAQAIGQVTGIDALEQWGTDGVAQNIWEALQSPATVQTYEDIDSLADAGVYALEALVEFSPQLATDALAAVGSGGVAMLGKQGLAGLGKAFLRRAGGSQAVARASELAATGIGRSPFAATARGGALASMYMQSVGETQNQLSLEGVESPETALLVGAGKAALDYAGFDALLKQAFKGLAKDAVTPDSLGQLLRQSATSAGVAASAESVTEATQTLMDELAIQSHKPEYEINTTSIIDAMLKGGVAGGGFAGAGHAAVGATRMAAQGYSAGLPKADDAPQPTAPEPMRDVQAQVANTPEGEGNWYTADNAEQAKQAAAEAGKATRELADGSVAVGTPEVLATLPEEPTQADLARLNGYAQTKDEALADPAGAVVIEARDAGGAVLRNQLVGKSIAEAVREQQRQKFPEATVEVKAPEAVVEERAQAVAAERPRWEAKGRLAELDPAALVERAMAVGIDPLRFQQTGLGEVVLQRVTQGLAAKVEGGAKKRFDALESLAPVLGMEPRELRREFYDSRNIFNGREKLLAAIQQRVKQLGGPTAFAQAIDRLPRSQAEAIRDELAVTERGGYDYGALIGEIEARAPQSGERAMPEVDLDSPVDAPPPARAAQPDVIRDAVFNTPLLRQLVAGEQGRVLSGDQIDSRIERLGNGERLRLEQMFKQLDIDVGGKNRQQFLDLLRDSVVGQTTYDIGSQYVDDEASGEASGARVVVPTQGFNPSLFDSDDAQFYQLVENTPLTDKAKDGWPAGLSLYLEAMGKIVAAGETEQSALTDSEALQLNHTRALAATLASAVKAHPLLDQQTLLGALEGAMEVTPQLVSKAAGRAMEVPAAIEAMAERSDSRVGRALWAQLYRHLGDEALSDAENEAQLAEDLALDTQRTVERLRGALLELVGSEPVDDLEQVGIFEAQREGDRALTATSKGHDAGQGENVAVDPAMAGVRNEQKASDDTFQAAVRRLSVDGWRLAVKPNDAQLATIRFKNGVSAEVTRRFAGANLLAVPEVDGSLYGRVVDAVALAMYAQSGEHVPTSAGEAASNLLENLARLMAGPQHSDPLSYRINAVVRTIPDDLVIFVDPNSRRGVTFGEGLNHRHAHANARARESQIQRELDDLTDQIGHDADVLYEALGDIEAQYSSLMKTQPVARAAVELWGRMILGEKTANGDYYRKPSREENAPLRRAVDAIGKLDAGGEPLAEVFGRYLGNLAQRKRLGQELKASREQTGSSAEIDAEAGAVIRAAKDGIEVTDIGGRDVAARRQIDEYRRSGGASDQVDQARGRALALDEVEQGYNPYAHDPLAGLNEEAWYDAEDRAQEAAINAWLAAGGQAPLFRLASTVVGESKPAKGMAVEAVQAAVEQFQAEYKGHLPLAFRVVATQRELYGDSQETVKGAYHAAGANSNAAGRVVLVAENLEDASDLLTTLRHEVLGHFGLDTFAPAAKQQVLDMIQVSRHIPGMRGIWQRIDQVYEGEPANAQAEEVFAQVAEQPRGGAAALYDRVLAWLAGALRQIGLLQGQVTRAELAVMAQQIAAGIRDGQHRQRTWPQTEAVLFRRQIPADGLLLARANQFWKKGVAPKLATVGSMVYSRIARYDSELARALFQPANAEASALGRSFEQRARAIQGRMMAQVDRVLSDLHRGKRRKASALAVQAAFEDAYSGQPQTTEGRRIRQLVDDLVAEAENAGLRSVALGAGFAPMAFDRQVVADRRAEFEQLVAEKTRLPAAEVRELVGRIVDGPGVIEGAIAPGMPVGTHRSTLELAKAIGMDQLMAQGWLLKRHDAALMHWVNGVSKRASWEAVFGDHTGEVFERDGRLEPVFDPNLRFKAMLDRVRNAHGEPAAREVMDLVNGALGRHPAGQSMPGWWRSTQDFITGWVGMTVLAFSGIASIPELALPLVRAGGRVGIGQMFRDLQDAKRFARDMGIVLSDASEQVMWQATGEQYRSPAINKMQRQFFRYNGNELIVRVSRTLATGIGVRYLLNAAADGDHGALQRLGVDAGTVHAWDQAGRPVWSPALDPATQQIAAAVTDAVNQFVNEATLNPSKFQATHWGNNPYLKMIWHLKHFLYTYGDTVLLGIWREMSRRWQHLDPSQFGQALAIAMPALVFGVAVLPLAAASLEARDWVRRLNGQRGQEYEGAATYLGDVFSRAGGLGPAEFLLNLRQQQEWGMSVFGSIAPVAGKVDGLFNQRPLGEKVRSLVPLAAQNKALWPFD